MQHILSGTTMCVFLVVFSVSTGLADAEEYNLTQSVQKDLVLLGYDPGEQDGVVTLKTAVAISKFQAENNLEVTGEVTPQLAGILSAKTSKTVAPQPVDPPPIVADSTPDAIDSAPVPVERDPEELKAAQQACLQEKMAEAREASKKKRGYGRLLSAVNRSVSQYGSSDAAKATGDVYTAGATASDLSAAAKDLGLTDDDLAECENPP